MRVIYLKNIPMIERSNIFFLFKLIETKKSYKMITISKTNIEIEEGDTGFSFDNQLDFIKKDMCYEQYCEEITKDEFDIAMIKILKEIRELQEFK